MTLKSQSSQPETRKAKMEIQNQEISETLRHIDNKILVMSGKGGVGKSSVAAEMLLENAEQNGGKLSYSDIVFSQRNFLKMKYNPVAIKYFFSADEFEDFKNNADYKTAFHPYTFCHYVAASRQRGDILLGTKDTLGCTNAKYVMGWKELDDREI